MHSKDTEKSLFKKELLVLATSLSITITSVIVIGKTPVSWNTVKLPSTAILALLPIVALLVALKVKRHGRKIPMKSWIIKSSSVDEQEDSTKLLISFLKRRSLGTKQTFYLLHIFRNGEEQLQLCAPTNTSNLIEEFLSSLKPELDYKEGGTMECPGNKYNVITNTYEERSFLDSSSTTKDKLVDNSFVSIGCTYEGFPIYITKKDFFRHVGVFGSTGSGKTTTCSIIASRLAEIGMRVVVLDWHGEYSELLPSSKTSVLKPVTMQISINPLAIDDTEGLVDILVDVFDLTQPQASLLSRILRENKRLSTLQELLEVIVNDEDAGGWNREIRLAITRRMEPLLSREGAVLFSNKSCFMLPEKGKVLVIDLSNINSNRLRKLYSLMYLRLIYAKAMKKNPLETVIIIDEAHNILPRTEVNFIAKMLAEVRKMMLGLVISTQSPSSINVEYLKNLNTKIVHRVVNGADKRVIVESLGESGRLSYILSSLKVGEALISLPESPKPRLIKIQPICSEQPDLSS